MPKPTGVEKLNTSIGTTKPGSKAWNALDKKSQKSIMRQQAKNLAAQRKVNLRNTDPALSRWQKYKLQKLRTKNMKSIDKVREEQKTARTVARASAISNAMQNVVGGITDSVAQRQVSANARPNASADEEEAIDGGSNDYGGYF